MPTRQQVLGLLDEGLSYDEVARRLGVEAGLAYMIATGLPADGGDTLTPTERRRPGLLDGSTQRLANPPHENPTSKESVQRWMRTRAAADAQMQQAAARRTASPGEIEDPDDNHDVLVVLTRQHNQVTALSKQLETIPDASTAGSQAAAERRRSIVDMITMGLSRHETAEEAHLWPVVREVLPDGDEQAAAALEQEQQGKDTLTALGRADPTSEEFDELVGQLVDQLRIHVAFEDRVFLALRDALTEQRRQEIGQAILDAQRHAPTRPHPHAPKKPAAAVKAAAAMAAPLDAVRDKLGDRPAELEGQTEGESGSDPQPEENV